MGSVNSMMCDSVWPDQGDGDRDSEEVERIAIRKGTDNWVGRAGRKDGAVEGDEYSIQCPLSWEVPEAVIWTTKKLRLSTSPTRYLTALHLHPFVAVGPAMARRGGR